eukprot:7391408-Prymnesium_polylepis.2
MEMRKEEWGLQEIKVRSRKNEAVDFAILRMRRLHKHTQALSNEASDDPWNSRKWTANVEVPKQWLQGVLTA